MRNQHIHMMELRKKLSEAIRDNQYLKVIKLQKEITLLEKKLSEECVTVKEVIEELTPREKDKIIILMNKVFVLADLLHGYSNDFEAAIRRISPNLINIPVCEEARRASKMCLDITKSIDRKDERFLENFQNMCDEIDLVACNIINKYQQRAKNAKKQS